MGLLRSLRSWKQDRVRVSLEKHEVAYIKSLARKYLKVTEGIVGHNKVRLRCSSIRKLCKYVLKTYPKLVKKKQE